MTTRRLHAQSTGARSAPEQDWQLGRMVSPDRPERRRSHRQPPGLLALVAVAVAGAVLLGATYFVARAQVDAVFAAQDEELRAIGELRVTQVTAWRAERLADVEATAGSPFFAAAVADWQADGGTEALRWGIMDQLRLTLGADHYENVLLMTPDGRLLAAASPDHANVGPDTRRLVERVTAAGASPALGDVDYWDESGHPHVEAAAAVRDRAGDVTAVLVLRSDPSVTLYPSLVVWPTGSPSGETLLVRRRGDLVVFLSVPRLAGGSRPDAVELTRQDVPAVQAVLGRTGRFEGRDYRGVEVLADMRPVPGTAWYLVNKTDLAEVTAEARWSAGLILLLALLTVILVGSLAAQVARLRRRSILGQLHEAEQQRTAAVRHFDRLFALARDAFLLVDPSGRIVEANVAAEALYGYSRDELMALNLGELRTPETRTTMKSDWTAAASATGTGFETTHTRRDGTQVQVEVSSSVLEIDGQPYRQSIIRDITDRKAAEAALNEQVEELRRWSALTLGREGRVLDLKHEVNELLGALGRPPRYGEDPSDPGGVDHD